MKKALAKTLNNFSTIIPMIIGVFGLVNLLNPLLSQYYHRIFTGNLFIDPLVGAVAGSISFGIPLTSYVIGGEMLKQGVSLAAVTAFIITWSTVGVVMFPLEAKFLGRRFALVRNGLNFVFALLISVLTVLIIKVL